MDQPGTILQSSLAECKKKKKEKERKNYPQLCRREKSITPGLCGTRDSRMRDPSAE